MSEQVGTAKLEQVEFIKTISQVLATPVEHDGNQSTTLPCQHHGVRQAVDIEPIDHCPPYVPNMESILRSEKALCSLFTAPFFVFFFCMAQHFHSICLIG